MPVAVVIDPNDIGNPATLEVLGTFYPVVDQFKVARCIEVRWSKLRDAWFTGEVEDDLELRLWLVGHSVFLVIARLQATVRLPPNRTTAWAIVNRFATGRREPAKGEKSIG